MIIEQAFAQDAEAEAIAAKQEPAAEVIEHIEITVPDRVPGEDDDLGSSPDEPVGLGFPLYVPGKETAHSRHNTLDEWQDAYEDLADKTARAGKRPARERMTILRELKEANEDTLKRVDTVKRIRHTAAYSKRLAALGAAQ
jgi:hypothetical protein